MALHIGRVEADIDIARAEDTNQPARSAGPLGSAPGTSAIEQLRPMVLQILREELVSFQRQQG